MAWAVVLVAGLAAFLVTSTPTSQSSQAVDALPAVGIAAGCAAGVVVCLIVARRSRGNAAATMLGVAAGIGLAGSAALIKICTELATRGLGALVSSWQLYAMAVVGLSSVALSQLAYRAGPMTASIPAINTVNPIVSVLLGWAAFDDTFRVSPAALSVEIVSLVAVMAATVALSRHAAVRHSEVRLERSPVGNRPPSSPA
jgi:drug/metabolite transporter (DMT)-like permease